MQTTIFWHDYETTGIDPALDRPVQFAGQRTDLDMNPIGDPINIHAKLTDDIVPSVEAFIVTGILPSTLMATGLNETAFADRVLRELGAAGTIGAGYNSLRFDDEFTRYLFYRNFLDPYAREWQRGNSRWDVIDLCRMACALRPEGIVWPYQDNVPSFRLEALTEANNIAHEGAHDAMADVRATIAVAKLLQTKQTRLFEFLFQHRDKKRVLDQLYPLGKQPIVHVSSMYPASRHCLAVVLPLCQHPTNNNGIICIDLSVNPDELIRLSTDGVRERLFTRAAEMPEDQQRMPIKVIHINRCPAVAPLATIRPQEQQRLGLSFTEIEQHQQRLQRSSGLVEKLQEVFATSMFQEADDPDQMLYGGGFFSQSDKDEMSSLRQMSATELAGLKPEFQDPRLPEMFFRYRARNYPDSLTVDEQARWLQFCMQQWTAEDRLESNLASMMQHREQNNSNLTVLDEIEKLLLEKKQKLAAAAD